MPVIGTSPDAIDRAEDRERFQSAVERLGLKQPENGTVTALEQAVLTAERITYPLVVRPSYVLGGRAMEIVYDEQDLRRYFAEAVSVSNESPVLLDRFLDDATEVDVDAICDGTDVVIGGIMEHIEQAGIHSGDSACSLPPYTLSKAIQDEMREQVRKLALELGVVGLMNVQFAVKDNEIYLIEVNPRAARTVPFVSKATGAPLAKIAARVMAGQSLKEQGFTTETEVGDGGGPIPHLGQQIAQLRQPLAGEHHHVVGAERGILHQAAGGGDALVEVAHLGQQLVVAQVALIHLEPERLALQAGPLLGEGIEHGVLLFGGGKGGQAGIDGPGCGLDLLLADRVLFIAVAGDQVAMGQQGLLDGGQRR